jgi:hypothetical protein
MRPRTPPLAALLVTVTLGTTACGADRAGPAAGPDAPAAAPGDRLDVAYDPGDGGPPQHWELTCSPPAGTHPDPTGACTDLAAAADPFAGPDRDEVCTEVYGGPQKAQVTGTWAAQPVDAHFDRVSGCAIARWDAVGRLLPAPADTALVS